MTAYHNSYDIAAQEMVRAVGKTIVLGVPLGIGKPIGLLNALYRLATADKSIKLTILTGLTLSRPTLHNELEKRLVEPILERLLNDYEDPAYEKPRELQQLPENIQVIEFFLMPGKYLHNNYVQQNYISSIYSNVVRDSFYYSINVLAQQVARSKADGETYSLSCNTDIFQQTARHLRNLASEGKKVAIVAEVNLNLPFMYGADAIVTAEAFTTIVDTGHYRTLFATPREELSPQDHLIGLYASSLIKDDGCLEIGIGKLSNAVADALIFRHQQPELYNNCLNQLSVKEKFAKTNSLLSPLTPFNKGLYASTEMFSDGYMQLYKHGILKKKVYDHLGLQRLLNLQKITEEITPNILDVLVANKLIKKKLTASNIEFLKKFGIFKPDILYQKGQLFLASGETITADLASPEMKQKIIDLCLGQKLQQGKILHAGFFLGSVTFYQQLRELSVSELQQIEMTSIARTNRLSWSYELLQQQRQHARFINESMMITLGGAIVSDGLKDLQEVSGVGGQFDFVDMSDKLEDARAIILCRSTRKTKSGIHSNIVWDYPNQTISRYLRDIIITEYGIADCRSKTDSEIIKAILNITDSRFQPALLKKAKKYGKLALDYEIPKIFRQNNPEKITPIIYALQLKGYCKPYPFGNDLTSEEMILQHALSSLRNYHRFTLVILVVASLFFFKSDLKFDRYLQRMGLKPTKNIQDFIYKKLLKFLLRKKVI